MKWLQSLLKIKYTYSDPFDLLKARGLAAMVWVILGMAGIYLLVLPLLTAGAPLSSQAYIVIGTAAVAFYFGVIVQINRGNLVAASLVFVLIAFIAVAFTYLRATTTSATTFMPLVIPVVAAGVLLNRRGMVVMLILVLLTLALGSVTRSLIPTPPPTTTASPLSALGATAFIMSICLVMLYIFAGGQRAIQRRALALTQELRSSTDITRTITGIKETDELLEQSVRLIRDQLGFYHCRIFLREDRTQLLVLRATTIPLAEERRLAPDDVTVLNQVMQVGKSTVITKSSAESHRKELLPNMNTGIVVPLKREELMLGVIDVQTISTDEITSSDIEVLEAIAAQIAIAIENTRLFSDLATASKERAQLSEQLRATSNQLEQFMQENLGRAWTRYLEGRGEGLVGFDWHNGTITESSNMSSAMEKAFENSMPELTREGDEQILTVPIISRSQRLGVMEFRASAAHTWSNRSIELAHVVAQRLALALDNLRLFEQAQNIATREYTASQIAATLQSQTDIDALISTAAEAFQQALGATRASVRLGTPERKLAQTGLLGQSGNGRHNQ